MLIKISKLFAAFPLRSARQNPKYIYKFCAETQPLRKSAAKIQKIMK